MSAPPPDPGSERRSGRIRPRFHELLTDPRHLRGDIALLRTAVRRGWLKEQEDRDYACRLLSASMDDASPVRARFRGYREDTKARVEIRTALTMLDMTRADQAHQHSHWPNGTACSIPTRARASAATSRAAAKATLHDATLWLHEVKHTDGRHERRRAAGPAGRAS